jgi:hypothetical protein
MDFAKAFKFPFDDPDWIKKIGILGLITLIPMVGTFVLIGFALETARRAIRQDPQALPELDFGGQLGLGFKGFLISLVYTIPAFLLYIPVIIATVVMTSGSGSDSSSSAGMLTIVMVCCDGLLLLYALVVAVVMPAAIGNFLSTGELGSAFRFGEVISLLRAAPGAYFMVLLGAVVANFVASLGMIACGVGLLFTFPYAMVAAYHLYGQAYRVALANGALSS